MAHDDEDEEDMSRLLRLAGPRVDVSGERSARVRRSVHLEWAAQTRQQRIRRRILTAAAVLAAAAAGILAVRLWQPREAVDPPSTQTVGTVERIEGETPIARGGGVRAGDWIETSATARAALRLVDGTSVRFDRGSRARLVAPGAIELAAGALYVDAGVGATGLEVRTPLGTAHDIGTQFEIRLAPSSLRLRVRSGLVELRQGARSLSARPGTELTVTAGDATSRPVSAYGPDWAWAAALAPVFETQGRPLNALLEHLAREHGWTLRFADARLARDASGIILSGSFGGLQPPDALAVALKASGLSHRLEEGELVVFRAPYQK
jgi:ferric-dicitrate binding protein FerR (iron transport regulator)